MQEIQRSQFLARKLHADLEHDARKVQEAKLGAMEATGDVSDSIRSLVHAFIHSFLPSFIIPRWMGILHVVCWSDTPLCAAAFESILP